MSFPLWLERVAHTTALSDTLRCCFQALVLTKEDKGYSDGDQQHSHPPLDTDSLMQKENSANGSRNVAQCRYRNDKAYLVQR